MGEQNANNFSDIEYVFLDRDGVLNRSLPDGRFVTRWEDFELLPKVADAIAELNRSGRKVIVVTNSRRHKNNSGFIRALAVRNNEN